MSSSFGKIIKISLFGESHSKCVGLTIDGLRSGIKIDENSINFDLSLRKTNDYLSTSRNEEDKVEFLSGVYNGYTTGSPLTFIIKNNNVDSTNYHKNIIRPSHADLTSLIKYNGFNDFRGGGHFSGRITTPLIVLGSICKQELSKMNILVGSHISSILNINDDSITNENQISSLLSSSFPVINNEKKELMMKKIKEIKEQNNSLGGSIETVVFNLPIGLGEPFFDSLESYLSHLIFSIGGVKGILFGDGINFSTSLGSEVNEKIFYENDKIKYNSNHNGGILGGLSNGEPLIFKTIIKPTPTFSLPQETINIETKENINTSFKGRFDPCIVHRICKVIDALTNYCIYEMILLDRSNKWNTD